MPLDFMDLLLGAVVTAGITLGGQEAVASRKARRNRRLLDRAIAGTVGSELVELRRVLSLNIKALRDRRADRDRLSARSRGALHPLPTRLDDLLRIQGANDLLRNPQAVAVFSRAIAEIRYVNLLAERDRDLNTRRAAHFDWSDSDIRKHETDLLYRTALALAWVFDGQAIVEEVCGMWDEGERRAIRVRSTKVVLRNTPKWYVPSSEEWDCLAAVVRESLIEDAYEATCTAGRVAELAEVSDGMVRHYLGVLTRYGLIMEPFAAGYYAWRPTARGRLVLGAMPLWWRIPAQEVEHEHVCWADLWDQETKFLWWLDP